MPHYYLNVRYSHLLIEDEQGHNFADLISALRVADQILSKMGVVPAAIGFDPPQVEISDDYGLVATVPTPSPDGPTPDVGRA